MTNQSHELKSKLTRENDEWTLYIEGPYHIIQEMLNDVETENGECLFSVASGNYNGVTRSTTLKLVAQTKRAS